MATANRTRAGKRAVSNTTEPFVSPEAYGIARRLSCLPVEKQREIAALVHEHTSAPALRPDARSNPDLDKLLDDQGHACALLSLVERGIRSDELAEEATALRECLKLFTTVRDGIDNAIISRAHGRIGSAT